MRSWAKKLNGQDDEIFVENRTMNHENDNINTVTRISNVFGKDNITKLIAGAAVGLALTMSVAMPGAASADSPLVSIPSTTAETLMGYSGIDRFDVLDYMAEPAPGDSVADITGWRCWWRRPGVFMLVTAKARVGARR